MRFGNHATRYSILYRHLYNIIFIVSVVSRCLWPELNNVYYMNEKNEDYIISHCYQE